jgi:hypothetical protein
MVKLRFGHTLTLCENRRERKQNRPTGPTATCLTARGQVDEADGRFHIIMSLINTMTHGPGQGNREH